jgi:transcriptional regulator with XRE-family HTH domain
MRTSADRLRKYIRAEREKRGWTQGDLADAAGVARNTVAHLERGGLLREGKEAAIEEALNWTLGSIDAIRNDQEPTPRRQPQATDPEEQRIADMLTDLDERDQQILIDLWRAARDRRESRKTRDQSATGLDTNGRREVGHG